MTDTERITALETEVAAMRAALFDIAKLFGDVTKNIDQWRGIKPPETAGGFYPVFKSMAQLFDSENALNKVVIPGLTARLAKLEAKVSAIVIPPPSSSEPSDVMAALAAKGVYLNNGAITLRASNGFTCGVGISENDNGFRINYNLDPERGWVNPATGVRTSYSNPKMMQILIAVEKDGVVSVNYFKPLLDKDGNPVPDGPFDGPAHGGKALCIRPGGHNALGQRGPYAEIYNGLLDRGTRLGTAGHEPNAVDDWSLTVEPDGSVHTR